MTDPRIQFQGVSLRFRIPSERGIATLKEWVIRQIVSKIEYRDLLALSDVSFSVDPGRMLAVIGHNGAGKSTLLRVAAGILQPSAGEAVVRGRLAPVIELGLGFEAELSGRENIYFNGALLGRSQAEMQTRCDEIVEFAELGDFIDHPIRTYSTGMVARLAFATATTVDANVLLLDEVLTVGDESFRRKCDERLEKFRSDGVTILLVTHNLDTVEQTCDDALWLEHGVVRGYGPAAEVVAEYRAAVYEQAMVGGTIQSSRAP